MPDMLITAAEGLTGVRVEAIRPHTGLLEAHRELELIDRVAAAGDRPEKLQVLVDRGAAGTSGRLVHRGGLRRRQCASDRRQPRRS